MTSSSKTKKNVFGIEYLLVGLALLWLSCIIVNTIQEEPEECSCNLCAPSPHIPTTGVTIPCQPIRSAAPNYFALSEQPMVAMRSTGMAMPVVTTSSAKSSVGNYAGSGNTTTGSTGMHSASSHSAIACCSSSFSAQRSQGISTSASAISGGVTSEAVAPRMSAPARISPPPTPDMSDWVDNGDGTITCVYCGATIPEEDYYDVSHLHGYGICTSLSPIVDGLSTILFMALLACIYVARKLRRKSVVRIADSH